MTFPPSLEDIDDWDALETGGGNWWETTATGAVTISPSDPDVSALTLPGVEFYGPGGLVQFFRDAGTQGYGASVVIKGLDAITDNAIAVKVEDNSDVFIVGPTGAVTISPSDNSAPALFIDVGATGATPLTAVSSDGYGLDTDPSGAYCANPTYWEFATGNFNTVILMNDIAGSPGLGFFGVTPAAKPTGVAVNAAGIHAALVTLGLIAA